jgi:hypothetical protein
MSTQNTPIDRPNFLLPHASKTLTPVFTGEQRLKAQEMLSSLLSEGRFIGVMQLINKDPTLALGTIPIKSEEYDGLGSGDVDFAFACIKRNHTAGYIFAIQHGYPINKVLPVGETLLSLAVTQYSGGKNGSDIGLLLSMGADPNIANPDSAITGGNFALVMERSFPDRRRELSNPNFAPPSSMLDARVNVKYPERFLCPLSLVTLSNGWEHPELRTQLTKFMIKLTKAGCDVDFKSGTPLATPLQRAVARENILVVLALIRLGAKPEIAGTNLLEHMASSAALRDHIPAVQSAIMERTIATSISSTASPPAAIESSKPTDPPRRRRMGAV